MVWQPLPNYAFINIRNDAYFLFPNLVSSETRNITDSSEVLLSWEDSDIWDVWLCILLDSCFGFLNQVAFSMYIVGNLHRSLMLDSYGASLVVNDLLEGVSFQLVHFRFCNGRCTMRVRWYILSVQSISFNLYFRDVQGVSCDLEL